MHPYRLATFLLLPLALAADIVGQVVLDPFPNRALPVGSKVVLDHGARSSLILHDGSFSILGVGEGEHILNTIVPGYSLPPTLYTIKNTILHAQPYHPSRLPLPPTTPSLPLPLTLLAAQDDYYTQKPGANILGMLKNPMVIMMLFSGIMMYFMPKMMASMEMDPDMAKDVAETRKKMQGLQNGDFMGSLSSILSGEQQDSAPVAAAAASGGSGNGNGKKGKRR